MGNLSDWCGSDRGGLSEGNFLAQAHLQQFDFDQAVAHGRVYSIWISLSR